MRLNRFLAQCGLGSRRSVEQLIVDGEVRVNGKLAHELATQIEPRRDQVRVRGRLVHPPQEFVYLMLDKPRGYDVTQSDRHSRRRAYDLLPRGTHPAVQAVGRLDRESTGLLLFTNDGSLAHRLSHPRYGCAKVYEATVEGRVTGQALRRMTQGVTLEDGPARATEVARLPGGPDAPDRLRVVMTEGRKWIVRRLCAAVGHPVLALRRTAMGGVELGGLKRGKTRRLTRAELNRLRRAVGLQDDNSPPRRQSRPRSPRSAKE